jgi:hypothetical protein
MVHGDERRVYSFFTNSSPQRHWGHGGQGWTKVEEFDFDGVLFVGIDLDSADAAVLDIEMSHELEGHLQEKSEDDPNDSSVTKDGSGAVGIFFENSEKGGTHSILQMLGRFAIWDTEVFDDLQPIKCADAKALLNAFPMTSRPVTKIHLSKVIDDVRLHAALSEEGSHGLPDPSHWAGIDGVELGVSEPFCNGLAVKQCHGVRVTCRSDIRRKFCDTAPLPHRDG